MRIQDFDDLYVIKFLKTFFVSCQNILVTVWWVPQELSLSCGWSSFNTSLSPSIEIVNPCYECYVSSDIY